MAHIIQPAHAISAFALIVAGAVAYLLFLGLTKRRNFWIVISEIVSLLGLLLLLTYMTTEAIEGTNPIEEMQTHPLESMFIVLGVPLFFAIGLLLRKTYIMQIELQKTSGRLNALLENLPEIIFTLDESGNFKTINRTFERKLEYDRESWIGKPIWEFLPEEDIKKMLEAARIGENVVVTLKVNSLSGKSYYFNFRLYFLKEIKEFIGIATDVTEFRLLEERLERYAKELEETNRVLRLFIDIISHDLINPLTLSRGYVEILSEGENREEYEKILRYLDRSIEIAENTKKFSKISSKEDIEMTDIDLVEIINRAIREVEQCFKDKNIELNTKMPDSLKIKGNELLSEVFYNILHNACKYSPENTKVEVGIEDKDDRVIIYFADQGEGIPDKYKESIFTRFYRMKKEGVKGTGLGLAIAKKVVELHNGRIWVEDNKPKGSIFKVELPKG